MCASEIGRLNQMVTKNTVQDMERCQESEMGNTHGMNGDFIKTKCPLYVQGQPGPPVAKHTPRSEPEAGHSTGTGNIGTSTIYSM
jgi:hypothetical protein